MKSINLENCLKKIINYFDKDKKTILLVTLIVSLIVHMQLYVQILSGPDTVINSLWHWAGPESGFGRFMLYFFQIIKGNVVTPILSTFLSIIFLGLTTIFIVEIFDIKKKYLKVMLAILLAISPNFSVTLTFFYCSDAYIFAMLLATLSVYFANKYNNKISILFSGFLAALAMGIYQTYISVSMVLIFIKLIIKLLNKVDIKIIFKDILKYIVVILIGLIFYYIFSHIMLSVRNMEMSGYNGGNEIGLKTLLELPHLLPQAYISFFSYFFNDNILRNTIWHTNLIYICLFILIFIFIIYLIIKNKIYKDMLNLILLVILIILFPITFGVIELIVPAVDIHLLMACSMMLIFVLIFKLFESLDERKITNVFEILIFIFCSLIVWNYSFQDNASYVAMKTYQDQTVSTMNRVLSRIENLNDYNIDMPIMFVNEFKNNNYFNKNASYLEGKNIYNMSYGFITDLPLYWYDSTLSYDKLFYEYIGVNIRTVSVEDNKDIIETDEYKNMESYPSINSIKIINDIVVVKF